MDKAGNGPTNFDRDFIDIQEQIEEDDPRPKTYVRLEDIRALYRDGEFSFTLTQFMTREQSIENYVYWSRQSDELVRRMQAAKEHLYHVALGYPAPRPYPPGKPFGGWVPKVYRSRG